ncbi:MAG: LuxR C-terminal-related transcriptional regulator [Acidimicrobiales bacterium]
MEQVSLRRPADLFVGRQAEGAEVEEALRRSLLVTVVGPPGVGKTRLALEVAANAAKGYEGVWQVELAAVEEADLVAPVLAVALGVPESPGRSMAETVAVALAGRHALVVLDNCEHLRPACASLVRVLAERCPTVRVLATSREPLGLDGEVVVRLAPLAVAPIGTGGPDDVIRFDAVTLFVDRARRASPGFALTADNAPAVADVCRRLDGIPFAVELAAARAGMLAPQQLAALLEGRLDTLVAGHGSGLNRNQTLEAALAWSYELLSGPEQVLLRRLSVFPGGATAAAAEAVCTGVGLAPDHLRHHLDRLVERSLVVAPAGLSRPSEAPAPRYVMLETVRHFARRRLVGASEAHEAARRHAAWAAGLATKAERHLSGAHQSSWMSSLDAEADNLRAALTWSVAQGHPEPALALAGSLAMWWRARGAFSEGRASAEAALRAGNEAPSGARAKAQWCAGYLAHMLGDPAAAPLLEEALGLARAAGDTVTCARALLVLASHREGRGELLQSLPLLEECAALARRAGDSWCLAHSLALEARAWFYVGRSHDTRRLLEESIAVARTARDVQSLVYGLNQLADLAIQEDDQSVVATSVEALGLARQGGYRYEAAIALLNLGRLALRDGDHDGAGRALAESAGLLRRLGDPSPAHDAALELGRLAQAEGRLAEARAHFEDGVAILAAHGLKGSGFLLGLAQVATAEGHLDAGHGFACDAAGIARMSGHEPAIARAELCRATIARAEGHMSAAVAAAREATAIARETGDRRVLVDCAEVRAGLHLVSGEALHAARLFGAAEAARDEYRLCRFSPEVPHREADLALLEASLPRDQLDQAWREGAALPLDEAAEPGAGALPEPPAALSSGQWSQLTAAESAVAALVAQGLTNRQISDRLHVSHHTVQSHLSNAFRKLSVASRTALAGEVAASLRPPPPACPPDQGAPERGLPQCTLAEFSRRFPDEDACLDHLWRLRLSPDGEHTHCPRCDGLQVFRRYAIAGRTRSWTCTRCGQHLHPTSGTIMHGSSTPLHRWFSAVYLLVATDCHLSATQLQRELGVGYKTAWRMVGLIRRQLLTAEYPG